MATYETRTEIHEAFCVDIIEQPAPGASVGGDVLLIDSVADGGLRFLIADMAGSGVQGHEAWRSIESATRRAWNELVASGCSPRDLRRFGEEVNRCANDTTTSLCAAAGRISSDRIDWATWGYGVHVLVSTDGHASPLPEYGSAFGLKLGWIDDFQFRATAGSFVHRSVDDPTRVMLFTDGILGEDHLAPVETWEWLSTTNRDGATIASGSVLHWLLGRGDIQGDDVTAALIEPNN